MKQLAHSPTPIHTRGLPSPPLRRMDPEAGEAVILEFLRMLCGDDATQHGRLLDWLTRVVQQPGERAETALFVSGPPRCGKGQLWDLLVRLMGHERCFETVAPQRDVWGRHNGRMRDAALVCIKWVDQRAFMRLLPCLRTVMTSRQLRIHELHQPPVAIDMRASFVVMTNTPLEVGVDDTRRLAFLQCSGARVDDLAYFETLCAAIRNTGAIGHVLAFLRRRAMRPWARARERLRTRAVVLYWLGLTEHLMAPGRSAEARDRVDYEAIFTES